MKSMMLYVSVLATAFAGCGGGGDEEPPSCQQAFSHYYEAGCRYFELSTGAEIPLGTIIESCREILTEAPSSCGGEVDDWLFCLDDVPSTATTNADCDCSSEQEALLTCD